MKTKAMSASLCVLLLALGSVVSARAQQPSEAQPSPRAVAIVELAYNLIVDVRDNVAQPPEDPSPWMVTRVLSDTHYQLEFEPGNHQIVVHYAAVSYPPGSRIERRSEPMLVELPDLKAGHKYRVDVKTHGLWRTVTYETLVSDSVCSLNQATEADRHCCSPGQKDQYCCEPGQRKSYCIGRR